MKRTGAALLAAVFLTFAPVSVSYMAPFQPEKGIRLSSQQAENSARSGSRATSGDFEYSENGAYATITGYTGDAAQVIVPAELDGLAVREIGRGAFRDNASVVSIVLPETLTSIGDIAFMGCVGLTNVNIPESVRSLGTQVFYNCSALTSIQFPQSIGLIPVGAVQNCRTLQNVTIPEGITAIGESAFRGCASLTRIALPNTLTRLGVSVFRDCAMLQTIRVPNSVTQIPESAFQNCAALRSQGVLPAALTTIGANAFAGCRNFDVLDFPSTLTSVGELAFDGCVGLQEITMYGTLTSFGQGAFRSVSPLDVTVYVNGDIPEAINRALPEYSDIKSAPIPEPSADPTQTAEPRPTEEPTVEPTATPGPTTTPDNRPTAAPSESATVPPETSQTAQPSASVSAQISEQPEPSKTLEPLATDTPRPSPTADPTWISSSSPDPSRTLEPLPTDTPSPAPQPSAPSMPPVDPGPLAEPDPSSGLILSTDGRWLLRPRTDGSAVVVAHAPTGTSVTVPSAIAGKDGRTYEITGLSGYENGGRWRSFLVNASAVTRISLPDTIQDVGPYTFYGCSRLGSIYLPKSVSSLGDRSFSGCRSLTEVTIPAACTDIGSLAFENCSALESVRLRGEQTKVGTDAFKGCSRLMQLVLGRNVRDLDPSVPRQIPAAKFVFYGAGPQGDLDESRVPAVVREAATQGYVRGVSIIPTSGASWSIEAPASVKAGDLIEATLSVSGLPAEISEAEGELDLMGLTLENAGEARAAGGNVLILPVRNGASSLKITLRITGQPGETAVLDWGEVKLNGEAAADNAEREIQIEVEAENEELVSEDGSWTFRAAGQGDEAVLTSCAVDSDEITVPQTVTDTRGRTYRVTAVQGRRTAAGNRYPFLRYASRVRRIILPRGLTSIGPYAFYGLTGLQSVSLPDTLLSVDEEAFSGCTGLTELTLPAGLRSIGSLAFENCSALRTVSIPGSVRMNGPVFYGCHSLTEMRLSRLVSMSRNFFLGLPALRTIWFGGTQTQLAASDVAGAFAYAMDENTLPADAQIICEESPLWTLSCSDPVYAGGSIMVRIAVQNAPAGARMASGRIALTGLTGEDQTFSFPLSGGAGFQEIRLNVSGRAGGTALMRLLSIEFDGESSADEPQWEAVILAAGGNDEEPEPTPSAPDTAQDEAFTLVGGSPLSVTGRVSRRYVRGITAHKGQQTMTVAEFLTHFYAPSGISYRVTDADGKALDATSRIATGHIIESWKGSTCLGRATVIVDGDVLGTGKMSVAQLVRMANSLNGSNPLKGAYLVAGMRTEHSCMCITLTDILAVAKELLETA